MKTDGLKTAYQLIAELFLSPGERDAQRVLALQASLSSELPQVGAFISEFLADPGSQSRGEYVQTLELSPSCPLYMGSHLFDEPSTCSGIGTSGRNAYMLELIGLYGHFEIELNGRELPDFLPVMVDFTWISLESSVRDRIALRRWFLERHMQPALDPLSDSLAKYKSPYLNLVSALRAAVGEDLRCMGDAPAWRPPDAPSPNDVSLPVLTETTGGAARAQALMADIEVRA